MYLEKEVKNQQAENALKRLKDIHDKNGFLVMSIKHGEPETEEAVADIIRALPDPLAEEVWRGINKAEFEIKGIDKKPNENLLTHREEIELFIRLKKGDLDAQDELIEKNKGLVFKAAFHYQGWGMDVEDLAQEGQIGLFQAIRKFDWKKGYKFSTFATKAIGFEVSRALENKGETIRHPAKFLELVARLKKLEGFPTENSGRMPPTDEELIRILEISPERLRGLRENYREVDSLDETLNRNGELTRAQRVADKGPGPEEITEHQSALEYIYSLLKMLTPLEGRVWELRHLYGEGFPKIGKKLGFSKQNAQETEQRANRKLRYYYLLDHPEMSKKLSIIDGIG